MLAALLASISLAGCATFEHRAREKATVFAALTPETQARLKAGKVGLGDTADMVYLALGTPDERRDQATTEGAAVVWIYRRVWQEYRGERVTGYHAVSVPATGGGPPTVIYHPVEQSIYQDREEERLRVTIKDGKVTVIETPRR
jgi:hypothetical protein